MIVLDTNIVSEMMKAAPNAKVHAWLNTQAAETLYLSSISIAELLFGVATMPNGKRREALSQTIERMVMLFENRILSFDA